jgi:hypothetical protein
MGRLFDYKCVSCGWSGEKFLSTPAPEQVSCSGCNGLADRRFSIRGLLRSGSSLQEIAPASGSIECVDNPDVPGLCHIAPQARRAAIAAHRGDETTLAAERTKQKQKFEQNGPPKLSEVIHTH